MLWLPLALGALGWHALLAELVAAGRAPPAPALRWLAFSIAFALPAAGAAILLRGPDLRTGAGRELRLWAHLATLAPIIATVLRGPRGLPTRLVWLALFGALLAVSLVRSVRRDNVTTSAAAAPATHILRMHRWSAVILTAFALLHLTSHLSAAVSLSLNTRVVDAARLIYKPPPLEALLLIAVPVQILTGLWLFRAGRDRARDRWDRLQLTSALYLAVFLAAHATATAIRFRDINFRAASGGRSGLFGDPSFLAYYVLGPLAVFAHLACGVRGLSLRRLGRRRASWLAGGVLGLGTAVTIVITLALCGLHLQYDRDKPQPRPAPVGWR
jgi:hypothetical protein